MKTTVELPESLIKQVKLRALRDGKKLQETMADLLQAGLMTKGNRTRRPAIPVVIRDPETGLQVIQCRRSASKVEELTPDRIAQILLDQEVAFYAPGR